MNKSYMVAMLTAMIAAPMTVFADPTPILLVFVCPTTTGTGLNTLSNFSGARIAGYGTLTIAGTPGRAPYFTAAIPAGAIIPPKIKDGNYISSGTDYDPENAIVSCSYTSNTTFSPFTVAYQLTNGAGGTIDSQTANSITIDQYVGFAG